MASTLTTLLKLFKATPGSNEQFRTTDINSNWDKIDQNIGAFICTSTTRPATPFQTQRIYETDTRRYYSWDGTGWCPDPGTVLNRGIKTTSTTFGVGYTNLMNPVPVTVAPNRMVEISWGCFVYTPPAGDFTVRLRRIISGATTEVWASGSYRTGPNPSDFNPLNGTFTDKPPAAGGVMSYVVAISCSIAGMYTDPTSDRFSFITVRDAGPAVADFAG